MLIYGLLRAFRLFRLRLFQTRTLHFWQIRGKSSLVDSSFTAPFFNFSSRLSVNGFIFRLRRTFSISTTRSLKWSFKSSRLRFILFSPWSTPLWSRIISTSIASLDLLLFFCFDFLTCVDIYVFATHLCTFYITSSSTSESDVARGCLVCSA